MNGPVASGDFRLAEWLVQPNLNCLTRGATIVHLRPKLMDLLVELAKRAGEVVPKEALIEAVWARKFVAESALSTAVAELRKALGEEAGEPRYIEAVPKRGYRLVAPVEPAEHDAAWRAGAACVVLVAGRRVPLGEGEHLVGRSPDVAVHIDSTDVSRHHARIVVRAGSATIEDLGSKNGTFVGGDRVTEPRALRNGDQVWVGGVLVVFRLPRHLQSTMTVEGG
jgi:DNA-binding winged helix-turn-helix (wHTH) protein